MILATADHVGADRVKVEDGSWNLTLSKGQKFQVDEERGERLLRLKIRGRAVLRVVSEND